MPMYDVYCKKCKKKFEAYQSFESYDEKVAIFCECGQPATRLVSMPTLQTDTNFIYTGKFDKRLGCKIEGRKHWKQKLKEKGYCELSTRDMKNMD
ncbi:MAG: zinc ribbon domain-containing protein [Candidatus Micrarchaeia archaeon]|jgi:putative FmdB family regulatory protein